MQRSSNLVCGDARADPDARETAAFSPTNGKPDVIKGMFSRMAPAEFAEKTGFPLGWIVVSHRWMPEKKDRRRAHGKWFRIKSEHGEAFRVLRFSVVLEGGPSTGSGRLVIDWVAWLELYGFAEDVRHPLDLELSRARWWQLAKLASSHPDPAFRLSSILAFVSVGLGLLSIVLALILT